MTGLSEPTPAEQSQIDAGVRKAIERLQSGMGRAEILGVVSDDLKQRQLAPSQRNPDAYAADDGLFDHPDFYKALLENSGHASEIFREELAAMHDRYLVGHAGFTLSVASIHEPNSPSIPKLTVLSGLEKAMSK